MQRYSFLIKWASTIAAIWVVGFAYRPWGVVGFFSHALILGTLIAIIGYFTDRAIPRASNFYVATVVDFLVATAVIYIGDWVYWGMRVTFTFAILVGLLVAGVEFFYHYQFVRKSNEGAK